MGINTNGANGNIKLNGTKHGTTLSKNVSPEKENLHLFLQDMHDDRGRTCGCKGKKIIRCLRNMQTYIATENEYMQGDYTHERIYEYEQNM